jgi:CheY-like chemotaxis protein
VLEGKRILWIDDSVTNNRKERELLEGLGLKVEQVQSNATAQQALSGDGGGYDLILSDIARPESPTAGMEFLGQYRLKGPEEKVPFDPSQQGLSG